MMLPSALACPFPLWLGCLDMISRRLQSSCQTRHLCFFFFKKKHGEKAHGSFSFKKKCCNICFLPLLSTEWCTPCLPFKLKKKNSSFKADSISSLKKKMGVGGAGKRGEVWYDGWVTRTRQNSAFPTVSTHTTILWMTQWKILDLL